MDKLLKAFRTSTILIICGTVLAVNGQNTLAIVLMSLGILGSIIDFSLQIQKEKEEKEEREKIYSDIKTSLSASGAKIPYVTSGVTDQVH